MKRVEEGLREGEPNLIFKRNINRRRTCKEYSYFYYLDFYIKNHDRF